MAVQVQASFKKEQKHLDGLDHVRKDLIDAPLTPRIIVAVIDVSQITHDVLDGSDTPKIRLRQVEVLDGADAMKAVDMLNRTYQKRTGREDSQASLFDEWDPGTPSEATIEARHAEVIHDAPPLDAGPDDDAPADEDDDQADEDSNDNEQGVPWVPDAPETAAADWPAEAPGVEFSEPATVVDPDVASEPDTRRGRRGRK